MPNYSPSRYARSFSADNPPPPRPPPTRSSRLELDFDQRSEPLANIAEILPRVVKCDSSTVSSDSLNLPFNLAQPLLIHSKRSVVKVGARSINWDKEKGRYIDTGDDILVPEDYPGWFGVIGPRKNIISDVNIPYYRNIGKLAIANHVRQFLVGGTTFINGFTRVTESQRWEPFKISPGEVLRKIGMFDERKVLHSQKFWGKSKSKEVVHQYLKCSDIQARDILLPLALCGVFYILAEDGDPTKTPVLSINKILRRYKNNFPIVVKLVYGPVPKAASAFKDTLLLTDAVMSNTVIASTMENLRNINLEIPLDNHMKFFIARHSTHLTSSRQYVQALSECEGKAAVYKKSMKVLVGISSDRDLPTPTSEEEPSDYAELETLRDSFEGRRVSQGQEKSPVSLRRDNSATTSNTFSRQSRVSVISRIITRNNEEQSIYAPDISPSASFKCKSPSQISVPEDLKPMDEFEPPQEPETITGVTNQRSISDEGRDRRDKFKQGIYQRPNSLLVSADQSTDSETYGTVWQSSSINRESAAGIRISSIPGRPSVPRKSTNGESCLLSDADSPTLNLNDHIPQGLVSTSNIGVVNSGLSTDSDPSCTEYASPSNNHPVYENTKLSNPATPSTRFSSETHYNEMGLQSHSNEHVYNELQYVHKYGVPEPRSPVISSSELHSHYNEPNHSTSSDDAVDGGYITPRDTNVYASSIDHDDVTNHYKPSTDVWHQCGQAGGRYAFFELQNENRDSGVYEWKIEEDPYDQLNPPVSVCGSSTAVPDQTHTSPSSVLNSLQQTMQERSGKMNSFRTQTSPTTATCNNITVARPTQLAIRPPKPPPLPKNHPSRVTPNNSAMALVSGLHDNLAPVVPKATSSRDALIQELKKTGLKASSELAIQSLQAADFTFLAQREDDLEEALTALLPKVGLVDLCKIAMCIKKMGIKLSTT
ncbi:hypothetical protein EGW08_009164 [Elysia chlorotica]|uniref:CABIT domain-containing protein n=1 Tax=Elysia chlorotica TaxID=188477 RepID=A0A433TNF3_ELYCH|nr:hypothetical protein EGW08_009164 [Elysia chlorotica]